MILGQLVTRGKLALNILESASRETRTSLDVHVVIELVEVSALLVDLLAKLGEPSTNQV